MREKEEEKNFENCPEEIKKYKEIILFNKSELEKMKKINVKVETIGETSAKICN